MQSLFGVLNVELAPGGALLRAELGAAAFREHVLPLFARVPADDELARPGASEAGAAAARLPRREAEWLAGTGAQALAQAERCYCAASAALGPEALDEVVVLLVRCLQQRHTPVLAHVAAEGLLHLCKSTGASFSQETWTSVCTELRSCFDSAEVRRDRGSHTISARLTDDGGHFPPPCTFPVPSLYLPCTFLTTAGTFPDAGGRRA